MESRDSSQLTIGMLKVAFDNIITESYVLQSYV